ncbi:uncharacterized protein LOC111345357 [Stylophora pistillata]|uniref:uncharacterized protein LOC111345357 n=1 Tax=Stylophora pistillata TaxID=50429 RepID=UPI000C053E0A|nr:uncharacterized protein LOC111345357 [Stylophora pistillata]
MIVSHGGPQFSSSEFDLSTKAWHIIHVTSSPMHQQAKGKAEAAVKSMKKLLIKTHKEGSDPLEALLDLSPAELMFKRKTCSLIPSFNKHSSNDPIEVRRQACKDTVKKSHDRKAKSLPELDVGQHIFFQHLEGRDWKFGEVSNILGLNSYEVKRPDRSSYRRNRIHLRPTQVNLKTRDTSPSHIPHSSSQTAPKEQTASTKSLPGEVANNSDNNASNPQNAQPNSLAVNRPRRSIYPPIRFNDYIIK